MKKRLTAVLMILGLIVGGIAIARGITKKANPKIVAASDGNVVDSRVEDYSQFSVLALPKDNIKLKFENKNLSLTLPVYI